MNPAYLIELRTRAHAAVLAATAMRHSESIAIDVAKIRRRPAGFELPVAQSKTDQQGAGQKHMLLHTPGCPATCPACLLTLWLDEAGLTSGPLFPALGIGGRPKTTPLAVEEAAEEFQRLAQRLGIDLHVGTHSFRKTHVTLRAEAGEEVWTIKETTHQTADIVHRHYVQPRDPFGVSAQL